jgi:hypothetical protein
MGSNIDSNVKNGQSADANSSLGVHSQSAQFQTGQHPEYLVDNAELLLKGAYTQVGFDLVITGPGGEQVVVGDYFTFQPPPNLILAPGLGISPEMVEGPLVKAHEGQGSQQSDKQRHRAFGRSNFRPSESKTTSINTKLGMAETQWYQRIRIFAKDSGISSQSAGKRGLITQLNGGSLNDERRNLIDGTAVKVKWQNLL